MQHDSRAMAPMVFGHAIEFPVFLAAGGPWQAKATYEGGCCFCWHIEYDRDFWMGEDERLGGASIQVTPGCEESRQFSEKGG